MKYFWDWIVWIDMMNDNCTAFPLICDYMRGEAALLSLSYSGEFFVAV